MVMTWSNPMPMRLGGGGNRLIEDLYATAKGGSGSLLDGPEGSETDLENKVTAAMVAEGHRAARARAFQADPRKLSDDPREVVFPDGTTAWLSPLERWERILGLRPAPGTSVTMRRWAVYLRRALSGRSDRGTIRAHLARIFGSWTVDIFAYTAANIDSFGMYWPLGADTPSFPGQYSATAWSSDIYVLYGQITTPLGTPQAEKDRRVGLAYALLDDVLPAHCTYGFVFAP